MKRLFLPLLLIALLILPSVLQAADHPGDQGDGVRQVVLLAQGRAEGDVIRLGGIARIEPATAELARQIIAWAPPSGSSRRLSKRNVAAALRDRLDYPVCLTGASACQVAGDRGCGPVVSREEILAAALARMKDENPDLAAPGAEISLDLPESRLPFGQAESWELRLTGTSGRGMGGLLTVNWAADFSRRIPFTLVGRIRRRGYRTLRDLGRGEVLRPEDLREEWVETGLTEHDDLLRDIARPWEAKSAIREGSILRLSQLNPWFAVRRGKKIRLRADKGSISLNLPGIAEESGNVGDIISVRNPRSQRVLQARVADNEGLCIVTEEL